VNLLCVVIAAWSLVFFTPSASRIPLCAGLTITTVISQPDGDYESIKTIQSVGDDLVLLKYSNEVPVEGSRSQVKKTRATRAVRVKDLANATLYLQVFSNAMPIQAPGTTAIGTSAAVLSALKAKGEAQLGIFDLAAGVGDPSHRESIADPGRHPSVYDYQLIAKIRRVEPGTVDVPLLVNGAKTSLPAIHAAGNYYGDKADFYFLDDEGNPLALRWRIGRPQTQSAAAAERHALEVVKIEYRCSAPAAGMSPLERALAEQGRADVYSLYFSFNSDQLREESEPTLAELGDLLRRHPDWKLSVGGHTDSIASDAFNLDLSRRRAAAVKKALVDRFGVDPARLSTTGYGESMPRDTNDTPEGRARNRRVELVRQ
jgi:outer membrane protein OmpA-like peptidoglycan-associated protein